MVMHVQDKASHSRLGRASERKSMLREEETQKDDEGLEMLLLPEAQRNKPVIPTKLVLAPPRHVPNQQ